MSDEDMPQLDDFQENLKTVQYTNNKTKYKNEEDYTKPNIRHIEDQQQQQKEIAKIEKKVQNINVEIQSNKKKESFGGFKKGFFSNNQVAKKQQKITEVKVTKKSSPLEIKQVQEAMKMNNYLQQTKKQWMNDNFLKNVETNPKIQKLFSTPEYMKAIGQFQTNPKEAMVKYGGNKQFMQGFQQFCKLMGSQFQNLAAKSK